MEVCTSQEGLFSEGSIRPRNVHGWQDKSVVSGVYRVNQGDKGFGDRAKHFDGVPYVEAFNGCCPDPWGQAYHRGGREICPCSLCSAKMHEEVAKKEGGPHEA
jgi:hypothetical protein